MTATWDPWHIVTVTTSVVAEADPEFEDDVELHFHVTHPEPHENGCPNNCMTQQEIHEQTADGLPTKPGIYRIRAWGDYWPGNLACEADWDGGVEVKDANDDLPEPVETKALDAARLFLGEEADADA